MTTPTSNPRWFHLTPDRAVLGLLAVEGLLWLSGPQAHDRVMPPIPGCHQDNRFYPTSVISTVPELQ
jgi:hypothetical protein